MAKLYESGENYLETILVLHNQGKNVRSVDIATEMEFPSQASAGQWAF